MLEKYATLIEAIAQDETGDPQRPVVDLKTTHYREQVLGLSPSEQGTLVFEMFEWLVNQPSRSTVTHSDFMERHYQRRVNVLSVFRGLFNLPILFSLNQLMVLLAQAQQDHWIRHHMSMITKAIERYLQNQPCPSELKAAVDLFREKNSGYADYRKYGSKLEILVQSTGVINFWIEPGEAWSDVALATLGSLPQEPQKLWSQLLENAVKETGGNPKKAWLKNNQALVTKIGIPMFQGYLLEWLPLVDQPRTQRIEGRSEWIPDPNLLINERNADILKALVWLSAVDANLPLARTVAGLAVSAYRKVPLKGPRCVRLGNACVWALGAMDPTFGIPQLIWLQAKVKFGTAQKGIDKVFNQVAEKMGLPRQEIEEMSVPTYGLEEVGSRREAFGEFTGELAVTGTATTEIRWFKPDGQPQKSVPAAVKKDWAEDLKELKQAAQEIQKMLPAQRDRIEALYLQPHSWPLATWQQRYLDHPLVGTLARRLIWHFRSGEQLGLGIWHQGQMVNVNGDPLTWLDPDTQVQLWHPIHAPIETIMSWRQWLLDHEVQQPFKQAHREVYLLTPAEETTRTYSNRFAAHILKQPIFHALCGQRGWKNQLRLLVDDDAPPAMKVLPHYGIRAEFWVGGIGEEIAQSGAFLYVGTDQVRFYPQQAPLNYAHVGGGVDYVQDPRSDRMDPLPLEQIPALVFSEIMRDVDLFVGVASVGNDPTWSDGGTDGRHRDYWQTFSFGELGASAQTRRQVLETLIPRLKIRDRCRFEERFLVVEGALATYRIHLGSGNILMDPGQRYLCIVPNQLSGGSRDPLFLPFEGDHLLAVILSKALFLAEDTKIKDQTILTQITQINSR